MSKTATEFCSWQGALMVGDSFFVRFLNHMTNKHPGNQGTTKSGMIISECLKLVTRECERLRGRTIIVLIGANDMKNGFEVRDMQERMEPLIQQLAVTGEKVVILTMPPIPCLGVAHLSWLKRYNQWLLSWHGKFNGVVNVVDVMDIFILSHRRLNYSMFERRYRHNGRTDLIHWNGQAIELVAARLHKFFNV